MKRDTLTLLGCSGSLAFMFLAANAAQAGTISSQNAGFVAPTKTTSTVSVPQSQTNSQFTSLNPNSDTIGDMAIAKFGCDCMSCRNQVMQMIQAGQLVLPQ